ncbi:MAG: divalent metal cation transporter [Chloroflexota bacterium]|nr:divalent metal cation transporter [Chloroflexota bacterium]
MKKILSVALGILTSIGGFLDVGAIATAAQAGAAFGFQLIWAILLGTICVVFLVEMSGRLAAVSGHTLADAVRERFGFKFYFIQYVVEIIVDFLVLGAEIGGVCIALQLVTGISFQVWALPVAFLLWLLLWKGTFGLIENGVALLGLVTLVFVFAAVSLKPDWSGVLSGVLPSLSRHDTAHYLFIAVSIIGALISPYLFFFYSSGAVEEKWDKSYIGANRAIAVIGMGFGSLVSLGVLIASAIVLFPKGIQVESYDQVALTLVAPLGFLGFILFAASLGIACFGAAMEVGLDQAFITAQAFGWNWSESQKPAKEARFSMTYTVMIFLSALLMVAGIDPLQLTLFTMALTATILPIVIIPFLVLMNDDKYVGKFRNGFISNTVVVLIIGLAFILSVVAIPLEILGGS